MSKNRFNALAIVMGLFLGFAHAQADSPWSAQVDSLFLKSYTGLGTVTDNVTNYQLASRFSISRLIGENNLGVRFTYFNWDDTGVDAVNGLQTADINNTDFEFFKRINLSNFTAFEFSSGIRYSDSETNFGAFGEQDFTGTGALIGGKAFFKMGSRSLLYSKAKLAILAGDGRDATPGDNDVLRSQTELGLGIQQNYCIRGINIVPLAGFEWMNFEGYGPSTAFDPSTDLGLWGFVSGLGINF